jgi:hypothetical protein
MSPSLSRLLKRGILLYTHVQLLPDKAIFVSVDCNWGIHPDMTITQVYLISVSTLTLLPKNTPKKIKYREIGILP